MLMNQQTLMLALFIALSAVVVTGLIAIPVLEEAHARSQTAEDRNKGQQGNAASDGKRLGCSPLDPRDCHHH